MFNGKIDIVKGFQSSVNIAYDLHNYEKVKNFIPTTASLNVIEDILLSTSSNSNQRARILIGAYGKGKSHIVLILLSLLFNKDREIFDRLLSKMKLYNPDLYEFALEYLKSNKKLLPIVITGGSASLKQSFLNALQKTLREDDLEDLMPETNFQAAINTIELWKKDYPETYTKFIQFLSEPIDSYVLALKEFDVDAYDRFEKIYPTLTSGSKFNPFIGFDVVELYESVAGKLRSKGYNGMYIVYDEFSKYLEASIMDTTIVDIKLLQDFAEKCDRSGDKQMHLMLICHKDIANYIDSNLPKEKVDGWKGVSGRFKHINIHNDFSQMYEIVATVIQKDENFWKLFCKNNGERFESLIHRFTSNGLFDKNDSTTVETVIKGCYPLHPVSTFILPRLSERVAQNERTLFTFLSSEQKYTLSEFLKSEDDEFPVMTPDYIYDYFEPLLRKEPYTSEINKIYKLTSNVLRKVDLDSLEAKIIKTLSLIYVVEQFEKLPPTYNIILDAFKDSIRDTEKISQALAALVEKDCLVYLKRSNNHLKLKESSGVDIPSEIIRVVEKSKNTLSIKDVLNKSAFEKYMYPVRYNDEMDIVRYFDFVFMESSEFWTVENWNNKIRGISGDGVVYAIIPKDREEIIRIKESILTDRNSHSRIVFIVPNEYTNIEKIAFEYNAVNQLKSQVVDDELLEDEYDIYIEDLGEVIDSFISSYSRPEFGDSEYFYMGEKKRLYRKAQISSLLSDICERTYPKTPIINNESINKNTLPGVAINSRTKLLTGLLRSELEENLGLSGTGQDVSIMRSTLIQTGILASENGVPAINLNSSDDNMSYMLKQILDFFMSANKKDGQSFKELYSILTSPEHGIGLKRGVIPIYIAAVLHNLKKNLVIKHKNMEVKITADILNSLNEKPDEYTVFFESWDVEKTGYMEGLELIFKDYVIEREKTYNNFSYLVSAMNRWYMSLPKYSKELSVVYCGIDSKEPKKSVPRERKKFINNLKQVDSNSREFLFEKMFEIFGINKFDKAVLDEISSIKHSLDSAKNNLINVLISDVKIIFGATDLKKTSLTSTIKDWYESLDESSKNYLFANNESKVLDLMKSITNDEKAFIEQLGRTVTSLRIDDWNIITVETFLKELVEFKQTVDDFDKNNDEQGPIDSDIYKIVLVDKSGNEVVKTFSKTDYSSRAKLLLNDIKTSIEEMGESISEQEKRQVLMELLEEMC